MLKAMASQSAQRSTCSVPMFSTRPHRKQHRWATKTGFTLGDSTGGKDGVCNMKACSWVWSRSTTILIHSVPRYFHPTPSTNTRKQKHDLKNC